ncbi:hypothetical protein N7510_011380 [Penicillium lagena]|uniref:uncharacterized protein n=1 Tax=Penicillium lagena TaxID=94218 RepID=UPI002541A63F|nr:uncharacterized protein N7510_011380 [Penicillium lagena]KAJ5601846.1 hypothetical protein N7510_011380 [Penicillium lagena]
MLLAGIHGFAQSTTSRPIPELGLVHLSISPSLHGTWLYFTVRHLRRIVGPAFVPTAYHPSAPPPMSAEPPCSADLHHQPLECGSRDPRTPTIGSSIVLAPSTVPRTPLRGGGGTMSQRGWARLLNPVQMLTVSLAIRLRLIFPSDLSGVALRFLPPLDNNRSPTESEVNGPDRPADFATGG